MSAIAIPALELPRLGFFQTATGPDRSLSCSKELDVHAYTYALT